MVANRLRSFDNLTNSNVQKHKPGTLVWVGPTQTPEFIAAHQFCLKHASQVALRNSLDEFARRPAAEVGAVIIACQSGAMNFSVLSEILKRDDIAFSAEATFLLMGSLCEGQRPHIANDFPGTALYWHRWNQILPFQLTGCGIFPKPKKETIRSVAIIASKYSHAEPLIELASRFGAAAIWFRQGESYHGRNFDSVWWDDSVAQTTSTQNWLGRFHSIQSPAAEHVWITGKPTSSGIEQARRAGVRCVLSKPFRLEPLEHLMGDSIAFDDFEDQSRRAA